MKKKFWMAALAALYALAIADAMAEEMKDPAKEGHKRCMSRLNNKKDCDWIIYGKKEEKPAADKPAQSAPSA